MTMHTDRRTVSLAVNLLVATVCMSLVACRLSTANAEGALSASVGGAKSLVVKNVNGSVEIVKDPAATDLQISAKVRCAAESKEAAEARLKDTKLVAERDAESCVRVQVVFPPREPAAGTVMLGGSGEGASLVIRAANLEGIQVDTVNGSITSGAFAGRAKLGTSNGSIRIDGHGGPVHLDTSNGSVETSIPSAKVVSASRGEATVTVGDGTKAKATIDTSNGRVTIHSVNN